MATGLLRCVRESFKVIDDIIAAVISHRFPSNAPCLAILENKDVRREPFSLKNIFGDGFLWAVPKSRRTVEKRWSRKLGPCYVERYMTPKTNLLTCNSCGYHYEAGHLCTNCYNRIMKETKEMQGKIQENLGLSPVEQDVVVLYNNEKQQQPDEFWEGKRIVEMKKERPPWFSKNLLQKSTQTPASSSDVKPTDLA